MITGLLGEVTAEKKRMEVWRMSGNRTSVLFPRKIRTANSARDSRSWQSADLAIGCFRVPASEFIFRIHLSQRRGHLLVCAFRSGGGKTKNVIAQAGAVDVCDCVVPQLFCFGG